MDARLRQPGPIPARPHAEGRGARALLEEARDDASPRRSAGVMTSSSPAARARRSPIAAHGQRSPGGRSARPSMTIVPHAMGERLRRSFRSVADGLIDEDALDARSGGRAGAGRHPAGQQRDRGHPAARPAIAERVRDAGIPAARRLRAERRQAAAARRRFHRDLGAQARRPAGDRRAAGPRPRDAASRRAGRRKAIAAARRMLPAAAGLCGGACGARLRRGHAAPGELRGQARR